MISLIAAMTKNRVIGQGTQLPWHLPADLKRVKRITLGKPIIMGRKTYESIGRPLPGRRNLVISKNPNLEIPGCEIFSSLEKAIAATHNYEEIIIFGGEQIFKQALPLVQRMYLTIIQCELEGDAFFPVWNDNEWRELSREKFLADANNPYNYEFLTLERKAARRR
jgi:dihydrofolate reductase